MSNYLDQDNPLREARPADDDGHPVSKIEIEFAIPTYLPQAAVRELDGLLSAIVRLKCNQPVGGVHWVSDVGDKPSWSQVDAALLGKKPDSNAPRIGEPVFDSSVLFFGTTARKKHPEEK